MTEDSAERCAYKSRTRPRCNEPGVKRIWLRSKTVTVEVSLCQKHLSMHNDRAAHSRVETSHS